MKLINPLHSHTSRQQPIDPRLDRDVRAQRVDRATNVVWRSIEILAWASIAMLAGTCGQVAPAAAEGSRELVSHGGNRPYTEWRTNTTAGILRRTVLKVYANNGEVINLGSSAVGVGAGNIKLFGGTANVDASAPLLDCKVTQAGKGFINTRAKEIAGPLPTLGGYTPCTYQATTSGVYQVIFYGPDGVSGATDPSTNGTNYITNPSIGTDQKSTVSMWDITVRSSLTSTTDLNGRVFTDYIALMMGANDRYLKSKFYILTNDGYRYLTDFGIGVGIDPNGFIFSANKTGLTTSSGQTLYHSGKSIDGDNTLNSGLSGGVLVPSPNTFSYPTFFNPPDLTAISGLGYPLTAQQPQPAQNFLFVGGTGGSGNLTPQGVGGTFNFTTIQAGSYQIIIDTNGDGIYNTSDTILNGAAISGSNSISWDGKDNSGAILPPRPGNLAYNARITLRVGEYHFPLVDVETATNGFKIQMLNPPGAFSNGSNDTTIYFDESKYTINGTVVDLGCSSSILPICDGRAGVDSSAGAHKFGTNYGDKKVIDTWIYFPSSGVSSSLIIFKTTISGKVWNDPDNSANNTFNITTTNKTGTNAGGLNAILLGNSGNVISTAPVAADGTYIFTDVAINQNNLKVQLSALPANWTNTTPLTTAAFNMVTSSISNQNFGIEQLPTAVGGTATSRLNPGGTINAAVPTTVFTGSIDPDGTVASYQITAFPANATSITIGNTTYTATNFPTTTGVMISATQLQPTTIQVDPFNGAVSVGIPFRVIDNGGKISTNTATANVPFVSNPNPNVQLVKRITAINRLPRKNDGSSLGIYEAPPNPNANWPDITNYLLGATNGGLAKPQDEVEYTIYFLSAGESDATNVLLCDLVPESQTFVANAYGDNNGLPSGIALVTNNQTKYLTNIADTDVGRYYPPSDPNTPATCKKFEPGGTVTASGPAANTRGAIVVDLGTLAKPAPLPAGSPPTGHGYVQFRTRIF
jgi:hypothetical protein